jgi:precorrin-6Y C5,15-methyltransferase (decarboxylating)
MSDKRTPWLSVIGIGEDGLSGLGDEAKRRIADAAFVFGGKRHLALAQASITGEARPWPTPFDPAMAEVVALRGRKVCVLASGDPFLHGVGVTLARHISVDEMHVIPAPSAFSLAASRLGWALQDVETVSLHGKPVELIRPLLQAGRRILALTSDEHAPKAIAAFIVAHGFGASQLTVMEALGGPDERIRKVTAGGYDLENINPLNVLAIEADSESEGLPLTPGLPDASFEHDGQITKREVRALTLSALAPRRGELLWDIGAGSGSIAIEWLLSDPSLRAIAIEADPVRAERIHRNARNLGVAGLKVVQGTAPAALAGLHTPDAIFIGGGGSERGVLDAAIAALPSGGRLVANAVTLELEALLLASHARLGGDLLRIAIARDTAIGTMTGWRPAMPVTQWSWTKP